MNHDRSEKAAHGDIATATDNNPIHEAFLRTVKRAAAISAEQKQHIIIEVGGAILRARTALPGLSAFREAMKKLPGFDVAAFDQFDDTSNAMLDIDLRYRKFDSGTREALIALVEENTQLRAIALADAVPLVARGLVSAAEIESIKDGQGRDDLSRDNLRLAAIFERVLAMPNAPTAVTKEEIAHLRDRAVALRTALERGEVLSKEQRELSDMRARIYTLFVNDWSQIRRAITFIRWDDGDAETIAPSLFLKGKRAKSDGDTPEDKAPDAGSDEKAKPEDDKPIPAPFVDGTKRVPQDDPYDRG